MSCWIRLGLEPTQDLDTIRQAYRGLLPAHHPETDPQGFQALRQAYEEALRLAREEAPSAEPEAQAEADSQSPALRGFYRLLEEPTLRFDPLAWQAYIAELDELPLDELDALNWRLLHELRSCGPISHVCAGLLATRLGWAEQLLRLENPQEAEAFLQRIEEPDPFDTRLMNDWPPSAQLESLWYFRSLEYCFRQRPLFEYEQFLDQHTCLAFPDDDALIQRLLVQFSQAGIGSHSLYARLLEQVERAPDDPDLLFLLARQADALGAEQQALDCWLRLWREHRHPQAERWLINLCARHQPQRLPLLIQALDLQTSPSAWPDNLLDPAQAWGSPAQSPQTLTRWLEAARQEPGGIAATFIDWRLDGDDELPLLAWLLQDQPERDLQRLYWLAWALQRGEAELLRLVLAEQPGEDALDALIVEGFQRQAAQQLHWLEQSPVVQSLVQFCAADDPAAELPEALAEEHNRPVCREWLRRMRVYPTHALHELNCHFDIRRMFTRPFALLVQEALAEHGAQRPAPTEGDALWAWHRQQLFMLALFDQPARWLAMIDPQLAGQIDYPAEHPYAPLHGLLRQVLQGADGSSGLLGSLDNGDPLQAVLASRLLTLRTAIDSSRLPTAAQLLACLDSEPAVLDDYPLGKLLFCAVLYHDRSLDEAQRTRLRDRIEALYIDDYWYEPLRRGLVEGKAKHPSAQLLQKQGIASRPFNDALDALDSLLNHCAPPKTRVLRALQKAKDDVELDPGLRCAIMALLSWTERMLGNDLKQAPAPFWAVWKLKTRLNRTGFALHLAAVAACGSLLLAVPGIIVVMGLLLVSGSLRRLRDMGQGVPTLLMVLVVSRVIPVLPLLLLGLPGDKLPNRYGPAPGKGDQLEGGLQATLRRMNS
ncbi:putative J domain-containing protein DjlC [Pseudomonas reidholzensis]|uniref:Putative J domain-containing protein DjlC n=1 Tax=Pseudomonas reidholzensis TaxID=1785162 RepID=A0A383RSJ5_9PSED|nr:J domain-containing protein [Pseudomonas reidholzensis]SYX89338.1 putative J domain-containing protein DjlC [Pseudomonas reidholzensis]